MVRTSPTRAVLSAAWCSAGACHYPVLAALAARRGGDRVLLGAACDLDHALWLQVAVGDFWSSEDGQCYDDMNAQVWQVPPTSDPTFLLNFMVWCGVVSTTPLHINAPCSRESISSACGFLRAGLFQSGDEPAVSPSGSCGRRSSVGRRRPGVGSQRRRRGCGGRRPCTGPQSVGAQSDWLRADDGPHVDQAHRVVTGRKCAPHAARAQNSAA